MELNIKENIASLGSSDDGIRMKALQTILKITDEKVDWADEVWDELLGKLDNENSYQRSIGIMALCNLAKSDRKGRLKGCINTLLEHTKDDKFITSRQCLQNVWKLALVNPEMRKTVLDHLEKRFKECSDEKHANLLREDILQSMQHLYHEEKDDSLLTRGRRLIAEVKEEKYRKKYEAIVKV